ncbi:Remorin C domain-containing protein [Abeliophyllum distichum]|uniref:Remorin C domain-containing protein n=1 Tax=Abeliophyllum distichum TaxID=126358 RepID=A0ABD1P9L8_9LAMI
MSSKLPSQDTGRVVSLPDSQAQKTQETLSQPLYAPTLKLIFGHLLTTVDANHLHPKERCSRSEAPNRSNLRWNKLQDAIPPEIGELKQLTHLDVGNNHFVGTIRELVRIEGCFPTLRNLYLNNNYFTGGIPAQLANLTNLEILFGQPIKVIWAYDSGQRGQIKYVYSLVLFAVMLGVCGNWDQKTGRSREFGFVLFWNQQDAQIAINDLTATPEHKGKISQSLAAKTAFAIRYDAIGNGQDNSMGLENRAKLEAQLRNLEGRELNCSARSAKGKPKIEFYNKDCKKGSVDSIVGMIEPLAEKLEENGQMKRKNEADGEAGNEVYVADEERKKKFGR